MANDKKAKTKKASALSKSKALSTKTKVSALVTTPVDFTLDPITLVDNGDGTYGATVTVTFANDIAANSFKYEVTAVQGSAQLSCMIYNGTATDNVWQGDLLMASASSSTRINVTITVTKRKSISTMPPVALT